MDIQELAQALVRYSKEGNHEKAVGVSNGATLLTQPGGLFAVAGMDRIVVSTHVSPMGLGSYLPAFVSNVDDPRYGVITGFTAAYGSEPVNPCDDAPKGYMKAGTLTGQFGRVARQTQTIEIDALLHQSRGATLNLQLLNNMFNDNANPLVAPVNTSQMLSNVIQSEMIGVAVQLERTLARMIWAGSPAANTANGGYKEFPGLDSQIATGQKDAETGTLLPSVDSTIINFGNADVDGTARDIVSEISSVENYLYTLAQRTGLAPATWAIVMRPELWFELTAIWPCRYLTDRCGTLGGANTVVINDDGNVRMRDEMRRGGYLLVNGRQLTVIIDDGIYEANSTNAALPAGYFSSSIYFVPLRVRGNFPVTYWEHIDYRQVAPMVGVMGGGAGKVPFWTDNGRLLWVYRDGGFCFDMQAKVEPRVILRTPQLAAKIQNVRYSPAIHGRDSLPSSPYWVNGGVSTRAIPAGGQAVWR